MRVSEARTKVCPFMTDNEGFHTGVPIKCICGDCMAWEYTKTNTGFNDLSEEEKSQIPAPDKLWRNLPEGKKEGYCMRLNNESKSKEKK